MIPALGGGTETTVDLAGLETIYTRNLCDMQVVVHGNSSETYMHFLKQFASVGCKTWVGRACDSSVGVLSMFIFSLDAGGDNVGATKMVRARIAEHSRILMMTVWCKFHQFQLIIERMLHFLDDWCWTHEDFGVSYFFWLEADREQLEVVGHTTQDAKRG